MKKEKAENQPQVKMKLIDSVRIVCRDKYGRIKWIEERKTERGVNAK